MRMCVCGAGEQRGLRRSSRSASHRGAPPPHDDASRLRSRATSSSSAPCRGDAGGSAGRSRSSGSSGCADPQLRAPARRRLPTNSSWIERLHEQPARRGAALAVEAVDHEDHGIERAVEIGVVEHDHRVLAAELEVHPLQRRRRPARMIALPVCRLADEPDRLDRRDVRSAPCPPPRRGRAPR